MADPVKYEAVIFDLDGTLLDTLEDLADSMNAALQELGFPMHDREDYRYFVGNGIRELAKRVLPPERRDEAMVELSIRLMSAEYDSRWNAKTKPYPGIEELLDALTAANLRMAVFSNKPDEFTRIMIPSLLPRWDFDPVMGARAGVPVKPDPQGALEIAGLLGISPERILYVGDTAIDMSTANSAGMYAVGVSWGFRKVEELLEYGAKSIIDRPLELLTLLKE